ncbi:uncharacterized protein LOC34622272 [Cyclospora cayetanensis]|uniref:Uncharacterized protein LOC34622272 n=1 Tax=Cyclospora cayetanensis TaxID=88456 RepID=A0A6P6S2J2_9EIME|nr:uncharacterized protein LOC34622272 [Cyclospora cayetanensis]
MVDLHPEDTTSGVGWEDSRTHPEADPVEKPREVDEHSTGEEATDEDDEHQVTADTAGTGPQQEAVHDEAFVPPVDAQQQVLDHQGDAQEFEDLHHPMQPHGHQGHLSDHQGDEDAEDKPIHAQQQPDSQEQQEPTVAPQEPAPPASASSASSVQQQQQPSSETPAAVPEEQQEQPQPSQQQLQQSQDAAAPDPRLGRCSSEELSALARHFEDGTACPAYACIDAENSNYLALLEKHYGDQYTPAELATFARVFAACHCRCPIMLCEVEYVNQNGSDSCKTATKELCLQTNSSLSHKCANVAMQFPKVYDIDADPHAFKSPCQHCESEFPGNPSQVAIDDQGNTTVLSSTAAVGPVAAVVSAAVMAAFIL